MIRCGDRLRNHASRLLLTYIYLEALINLFNMCVDILFSLDIFFYNVISDLEELYCATLVDYE